MRPSAPSRRPCQPPALARAIRHGICVVLLLLCSAAAAQPEPGCADVTRLLHEQPPTVVAGLFAHDTPVPLDPMCAVLVAEALLAADPLDADAIARARPLIALAARYADAQRRQLFVRVLFHRIAYLPDPPVADLDQLRARDPHAAARALVLQRERARDAPRLRDPVRAIAPAIVAPLSGCKRVVREINAGNVKRAEAMFDDGSAFPAESKCAILLAEYFAKDAGANPDSLVKLQRFAERAARFVDPREREANARMLALKLAWLPAQSGRRELEELRSIDPKRAEAAMTIRYQAQIDNLRGWFQDPTGDCSLTADDLFSATDSWQSYKKVCAALRDVPEPDDPAVTTASSYYFKTSNALTRALAQYPVPLPGGGPIPAPPALQARQATAVCLVTVEQAIPPAVATRDLPARVQALKDIIAQQRACPDGAAAKDVYGIQQQLASDQAQLQRDREIIDMKAALERDIVQAFESGLPTQEQLSDWQRRKRAISDTRYSLGATHSDALGLLQSYYDCQNAIPTFTFNGDLANQMCVRFIADAASVPFGQDYVQAAADTVRGQVLARTGEPIEHIRRALYEPGPSPSLGHQVVDLGVVLRKLFDTDLPFESQFLLDQLIRLGDALSAADRLNGSGSLTPAATAFYLRDIAWLDPAIAQAWGFGPAQNDLTNRSYADAPNRRVKSAFAAIDKALKNRSATEQAFTVSARRSLFDFNVTPCIGTTPLTWPIARTTTWYWAAYGECRAWHGDWANAINNFGRGWNETIDNPDTGNKFLALIQDVQQRAGWTEAKVLDALKQSPQAKVAYQAALNLNQVEQPPAQNRATVVEPAAPDQDLGNGATRNSLPYYLTLNVAGNPKLSAAFDRLWAEAPRISVLFNDWDQGRAGTGDAPRLLKTATDAALLRGLLVGADWQAAAYGLQQTFGPATGLWLSRHLEARRFIELGCPGAAAERLALLPPAVFAGSDRASPAAQRLHQAVLAALRGAGAQPQGGNCQ